MSKNDAFSSELCSKTSKFIKLCKGDMSRQPKTAKINLGRNRRALNSRAALTRRAIPNTWHSWLRCCTSFKQCIVNQVLWPWPYWPAVSVSPPLNDYHFVCGQRSWRSTIDSHRRDSWSFPERGRNSATAASLFKDLASGTVFLLSWELQTFQWLCSETNLKLICLTPRNCFSAFAAPFLSCAATCELALYKSH